MATLRGISISLAIVLNTIVIGAPLLLLSLFKLLPGLRDAMTMMIVQLADRWALNNRVILRVGGVMQLTTEGMDALQSDRWYLVVSNHQSWVDIFILHCTLTGRIAPIKFFMKQQLIWVPILGLACWALDFPFMKRFSREYLEAHPEKRGQDIETTRRACERFSRHPASLLNFLEGTRFTHAKHAAQGSPFRHLLKPKPGGFAFVIDALGERVEQVIDATVVYANGAPSFWEFVCGRAPDALLHIQVLPIPDNLRDGDYSEDADYRARVQAWLAALWEEKDTRIENLGQAMASRTIGARSAA